MSNWITIVLEFDGVQDNPKYAVGPFDKEEDAHEAGYKIDELRYWSVSVKLEPPEEDNG